MHKIPWGVSVYGTDLGSRGSCSEYIHVDIWNMKKTCRVPWFHKHPRLRDKRKETLGFAISRAGVDQIWLVLNSSGCELHNLRTALNTTDWSTSERLNVKFKCWTWSYVLRGNFTKIHLQIYSHLPQSPGRYSYTELQTKLPSNTQACK